MLFFTRAFICIGAIVVLAEGFGPADLLRGGGEVTGSLAPAALAPVTALCRSKPETCMAIATAALRAAPAGPPEGDEAAPIRPSPRRGAARPVELSSRPPAPR